jgi:hypothetical protein
MITNESCQTANLKARLRLVDKASGIAGMAIFASMLGVFDSFVGRAVVSAGIVAALIATSQAFAKQIRLSADAIVVRSTFWRTRSFTYHDVDHVVFDPTSVLVIVMKSGETVSFPAKGERVKEAFDLLLVRTSGSSKGSPDPTT